MNGEDVQPAAGTGAGRSHRGLTPSAPLVPLGRLPGVPVGMSAMGTVFVRFSHCKRFRSLLHGPGRGSARCQGARLKPAVGPRAQEQRGDFLEETCRVHLNTDLKEQTENKQSYRR